MKKTMALVPALLIAGLVAGCGSSDDGGSDDSSSGGDYCDIAKGIKADVEGIDFTTLDSAAFDELQENFDKLEAAAPDGVKDDWALVGDKFDDLEKILDDAGLELDDLAGLQAGEMPEGFDVTKLQELSTQLTEFGDTTEIEPALENLQKSLKDDCGIDTEDTTDSTPSSS